MFLYIFIRFRNWQFGVAAVISQFHDALFVIGLYSVLWKVVPWSMEIDQYFIAAVLTVIGYSINDTIIIFDRIREWVTMYPKRPLDELYNSAVNSTLSRSLNTSLSTMFVLLVICIFGGEMLRGFAFAIFIGTGIGTYSSIFNGTPLVYDLITRKQRTKGK
jgi:SecD/SecF fusion protein